MLKFKTYEFQREYKKTIIDLSNILAIQPNHVNALHSRAQNYMRTRQKREAVADFNKIIEINPSDGWAYFYRGILRRNLKEKESACVDLKKASELGILKATEFLKTSNNLWKPTIILIINKRRSYVT